jgi:hypothetical protein
MVTVAGVTTVAGVGITTAIVATVTVATVTEPLAETFAECFPSLSPLAIRFVTAAWVATIYV